MHALSDGKCENARCCVFGELYLDFVEYKAKGKPLKTDTRKFILPLLFK